MKRRFALAIVLLVLLSAVPASAGPGTLFVDDDDSTCSGNSPCYSTIQAAINDAASGDTVQVASGTYPEQLTVDKPLTLLGEAGLYPAIQPALNTSSKYDTVISVLADNVTIQGFDISNALGVVDTGGQPGGTHIEHHAIWDKAWTLGPSGLTVHDCVIHDIEHGVRSYGPDLTVTGCEMYSLRRSGVHASGPYQNQPLGMTIQNNWFHDWYDYYKEGAGVYVKYDSRVGLVSHNYISGMRMGIAYYYGGPKATYGQQIVFSHNTIDMDYDLGSGPVDMTMGFSFWGTGTNADAVIVRDNIIANARWYGIYQEGATLVGAITVDSNLFYNNYWYYWPDYQYPHQWFGGDARAQAGWTGGAAGFTFANNTTAQDPLFALADPGPEGQWALTCGSPAHGTASDGTNIGAWQGEPVCEIEVIIDIKPGSDPNSINLKSKGKVPVAILSSAEFDASTVDPATVEFAGAAPLRWTLEDVDGDGDLDLLFHFLTQELELDENSTEASLSGTTFDGNGIHGTDTVNMVPKGKK